MGQLNMDALTHLNFLKLTPLKNWLDYIVDLNKFVEYLNEKKGTNDLFELADQFIEKSMSAENEAIQLEEKKFDANDVRDFHNRATTYWLCAAACLATNCWNVEALAKCSSIIKVKYFLQQFTHYIKESDKPRDNIVTGPESNLFWLVDPICPTNIFAYWMYARFVLFVDTTSRVSNPTTKPTVSNPYLQLDQGLIQAEQTRQVTIELRQQTSNAVKFLLKLLLAGDIENVNLPLKELFLHQLEKMINEESMDLRQPVEQENANGEFYERLEWQLFSLKTQFDIMVAHFAARHFTTAKKILEEIFNDVEKNITKLLSPLLRIDRGTFYGYKAALRVGEERKSVVVDPSRDFSIFIKYALASGDEFLWPNFIKLFKSGCCISAKAMEAKFKIKDFLEDLNCKCQTNIEVERVNAALYFLAALCPNFNDADKTLVAENHLQRRLVQPIELAGPSIPQIPPNVALEDLASSGPPLWNLFTSFNIDVLNTALQQWDTSKHLPYRHHVSNIISPPVLNSAGKDFNRRAILLWRLEQLALICNVSKWEALIDNLSNKEFSELVSNQEFRYLLVYDAIRVKAEVWNRQFFRHDTPTELSTTTQTLITNVETTIKHASKLEHKIGNMANEVCSFMLNNSRWDFFNPSDIKCLKGAFSDFSVFLAAYFKAAIDERNTENAVMVAHQHIWKTLTPTFEIGRRGISSKPLLISQQQLMQFVANIKETNILNFLLGFSIVLYNSHLASKKVASQGQDSDEISPLSVTNPEAQIKAAKKTMTKETTPETKPNEFSQITSAQADQMILKSVSPLIKNEQAALWKSVNIDEITNKLDVPFLESMISQLCQNALLTNPVSIIYQRIQADLYFARGKYREAIAYYVEILVALERSSSSVPIDDSIPLETLNAKIDLKKVYAKLVVSLYFIHMPTLAIVLGQFRSDANDSEHIQLVEAILQSTPLSVDAGPIYFPMLFNVDLIEEMAAVYDKLDLPIYLSELLRHPFNRALNRNNQPRVLQREEERIRQRLLNILAVQFFDQY